MNSHKPFITSHMDEHIASIIIAYLGGPYFALELRATCRVWRALIPRPQRRSPDNLLREAASIGDLRLCELAIARGANKYCVMAARAARAGHRNVCELVLAKDNGYSCLSMMIEGAARAGDFELCDIIERYQPKVRSYSFMGAARSGHLDYLLSWSMKRGIAREYSWNDILAGAARGGHSIICRLALDHGANEYGNMLRRAARGGHDKLCKWAFDLINADANSHDCAEYADEMLYNAARGGHRNVCEQAIARGASDFGNMLSQAARGGHRELCVWARELLGVKEGELASDMNHNGALIGAAYKGRKEMCAQLCAWGATTLASAFNAAMKRGHYELCLQIERMEVQRRARELAIAHGVDLDLIVTHCASQIVANLRREAEMLRDIREIPAHQFLQSGGPMQLIWP